MIPAELHMLPNLVMTDRKLKMLLALLAGIASGIVAHAEEFPVAGIFRQREGAGGGGDVFSGNNHGAVMQRSIWRK